MMELYLLLGDFLVYANSKQGLQLIIYNTYMIQIETQGISGLRCLMSLGTVCPHLQQFIS